MNRFGGWLILALAASVPAATVTLRAPLKYRRDLPKIAGSPKGHSSQSSVGTLESATSIELVPTGTAHTLVLRDSAGAELVRQPGIDLGLLVPRLPYPLVGNLDEAAAMDLRLTEYARVGVRYPVHGNAVVTELTVVNNCLRPGLWELALRGPQDQRTRMWFTFPTPAYLALVAGHLDVPVDQVRAALLWEERPAPARLDRLRVRGRELSNAPASLDRSFAFQALTNEQARKLQHGLVAAGPPLRPGPLRLSDLRLPVRFTDFVPPGRYQPYPSKSFDLGFLLEPGALRAWQTHPRPNVWRGRFLEFEVGLGPYRLVIGNLTEERLREPKGVHVNGMGVGVPGTRNHLAERLAASATAPIYAYLIEGHGPSAQILNTHAIGIETLDLHLHAEYLTIVIGSFERMVSLVKLRGRVDLDR